MVENASLSDYLFELRRGAPPQKLAIAIGLGVLTAFVGALRGPAFAGMIGLGAAISGICTWAWLSQIVDRSMDERYAVASPLRGRKLRALAILALGVAAVGSLVFFYAFFVRFLFGTTIGTTGM